MVKKKDGSTIYQLQEYINGNNKARKEEPKGAGDAEWYIRESKGLQVQAVE